MARLNEPAPPPQPFESIDALKRRFIRQNREIARANSTQSLRIRNLEQEVSRLLAENLGLREQIIRLENEVDQRDATATIGENVDLVRNKLEGKMAEFMELIAELGVATSKNSSSKRRRRSERTSLRNSLDQQNWKNAMTLADVTGQEGRLPPIMEDKYYPRKTLDPEELLETLADTNPETDSPDLGPPPVAHFYTGDPIKFDPEKNTTEDEPEEMNEVDGLILPPTLETRRKRRDSIFGDLPSTSQNEELQTSDIPAVLEQRKVVLKSGAKRKLSVRDDEEDAAISSPEDFQYTRRKPTSDTESGTDDLERHTSRRSSTHKSTQHRTKERSRSRSRSRPGTTESYSKIENGGRRALASKSTNMDPKSPSKKDKEKDCVADKIADLKKDAVKQVREKDHVRSRKPTIKVIKPSPTEELTQSDEPKEASSKQNPETPAAADLFSPPSIEPTARVETRDTPPPEDISNDTAFNSFGRSTRRARPVSYAEPNLRDKMRRPTKELVDAVGPNEHGHRPSVSSIKIEDENRLTNGTERESEGRKIRTVIIKTENGHSANWKNLPSSKSNEQDEEQSPPSPLGDKSAAIAAAQLPASVMTERKRRVSSQRDQNSESNSNTSSNSHSNSETMVQNRKSSTGLRKRPSSDEKDIQDVIQHLDIYEFNPTSPPDPNQKLQFRSAETKQNGPSRGTRRHSAAPVSSSVASRARKKDMNDARDRQEEDNPFMMKVNKNIAGRESRNSRTSGGMRGVPSADVAARLERAARRRRSMMI
ncbi:MAG: hypothetical protein M1834_001912 [Cirrosporium novae-zelandiae]|nr:MAG: hypothetical protein M1834_001912 [Cirrosporium novae-zelandiae]